MVDLKRVPAFSNDFRESLTPIQKIQEGLDELREAAGDVEVTEGGKIAPHPEHRIGCDGLPAGAEDATTASGNKPRDGYDSDAVYGGTPSQGQMPTYYEQLAERDLPVKLKTEKIS